MTTLVRRKTVSVDAPSKCKLASVSNLTSLSGALIKCAPFFFYSPGSEHESWDYHRVFKIAAVLPVEKLQPGVVHSGIPFDVTAFLQAIEKESQK